MYVHVCAYICMYICMHADVGNLSESKGIMVQGVRMLEVRVLKNQNFSVQDPKECKNTRAKVKLVFALL